MRSRVLLVALLLAGSVALPISTASGSARRGPSLREPVSEIDDPDVDEFSIDAAPGVLVWSQGTEAGSDAFLEVGTGDPVQLDASGVDVSFVATDGQAVALSEFGSDGGLDLTLLDVATRTPIEVPPGVNTARNEDWPSIDGDRLFFLRAPGPDDRASPGRIRAILFDLATGEKRVLASLPARNSQIFVGQVEGDFAAWSTCFTDFETFTVNDCQVFRYRISTGEIERVPNPRFEQFAPMVTADGTVYFSRNVRASHWVCGDNVRIMRYPLGGPVARIASVPEGYGDFWGHAVVETDGSTTLHFYRPACETFTGGIYRIEDANGASP